jgi:hypothetical protein
MAKGDVTLFAKFKERVGDGDFNLSTDVLKIALTTDTTGAPPAGGPTATDPWYGAGGSQNLATNEVAAGGGYSTGGIAIDGSDPWAISTNDAVYTGQNPTWLSSFSGDPANCRYGVIYVDGASKYGVGYVQVYDGTTDVSLLVGDIVVKWNSGASSGTIFSL